MFKRFSALLGCASLLIAACAPATAPASLTAAANPTGVPTAGATAAATTGGAAPAANRSSNQVLKVAQTGIPASLSPETSSSNFAYFSAIFDSMITFGKDFKVLPQVAEKWQYNGDTWRFTIRKDLRFTDGSSLTAEDVAFTLNLIVEKNLPQKVYLPGLASATVVDPVTVDVTTNGSDVSLLNGMAWAFILPKGYYERVGKDEFQTKAIGTGPYEVAEYQPSQLAVFKKKSTKHPFRDPIATELRFQSVPEVSAVASGLRTGDIDLTAHVTFPVDVIDAVTKDGVKAEYLAGAFYMGVFSQPEAQDRNSPLTNIKVRQALNYAVDRDSIAKVLFKGYGSPTGQLILPTSALYIKDLKPWPFDPAKAKQLLAEAGYPNGFKLPVGIDFTPTSINAQVPQAIQSYLRDVGIDAPVNSYEIAIFLDKFYGRNGQTKGDIWMAVSGDANGMGSTLRGNFSCDKPREAIWWCNQEFNKLFDAAMAEPDDAKRSQQLQKAQQVLLDDVPALYLINSPLFVAHGAKIMDVEFYTPLVYRFDSVYRAN